MERIKLTIPSQQVGQHILVETEPTKLARWLKSLPLADMSKTLPELTRAISSLNRTELSYKQRSELVKFFDETYTFVHDYFRPNVKASLKNNSTNEKMIDKLHIFTKEMAFAHKIIVSDAQGKKQFFGKNKVEIRSIDFSIFYLGLMLIEQYELYSPIPIYLWREINSLYAYAGKKEYTDIVIENDKTYCLPSIQQSYIRNCLLALADPYHLDRGEHWYLFHYLHLWVKLARISENPDDFRKEECFIIDITSENKPNFVTQELDDPEDPKIRLLLTYNLIRQIKFDSETLDEKGKIPDNSFNKSIKLSTASYLWQHVSRHWNHRIKRDNRRYPIVSKIDVVWGLRDIIRILGLVSQNDGSTLSAEEIVNLTNHKDIQQLSWGAINVSSGGIGICTRQFMLPHVDLGNIALIREYMDDNPAPHWRLAICRWHTGDENNGTMLGLEYIDGRYTPIRLVLHQGQNEKGGQPGLVVSSTQLNGSDAPTIITAKDSYNSERVYAMLGLDDPVEVRPRARVESTSCVDRFFYQTFELRDELAEEVLEDVSDVIPWTSIPPESCGVDAETDEFNIVPATLNEIRLPGDH